jgi:hypothetical protein
MALDSETIKARMIEQRMHNSAFLFTTVLSHLQLWPRVSDTLRCREELEHSMSGFFGSSNARGGR